MNVLLLGATGFSGKEVLKELLRRKYTVTAITRKAQSLQAVQQQHPNLKILEGNVLDADFIQSALQGQDAVIDCLGIGKNTGKPNSLVSDAVKILVKAMENSSTKRLIGMSNVGAGNSWTFYPWFFKALILPYFMKWLQYINSS